MMSSETEAIMEPLFVAADEVPNLNVEGVLFVLLFIAAHGVYAHALFITLEAAAYTALTARLMRGKHPTPAYFAVTAVLVMDAMLAWCLLVFGVHD
jgi:hypothetical protein